jgi:hypothetical protein
MPKEDMAKLRFHAIREARAVSGPAGIAQAIEDCPGERQQYPRFPMVVHLIRQLRGGAR